MLVYIMRMYQFREKYLRIVFSSLIIGSILFVFSGVTIPKITGASNNISSINSGIDSSKYNSIGIEVIVPIFSPVKPLDFIKNAEAFDKLPSGTKVSFTYGEPKTNKALGKAPVSITVTYPDNSQDIVPAALTVIDNRTQQSNNTSSDYNESGFTLSNIKDSRNVCC